MNQRFLPFITDAHLREDMCYYELPDFQWFTCAGASPNCPKKSISVQKTKMKYVILMRQKNGLDWLVK